MKRKPILHRLIAMALGLLLTGSGALAQQKKPNILVIWGDDIGYWNISHNNRGMMGYKTPNIDRVAREGVSFTDYYAQQSCTAGRAAFISGSVPVRSGMTKVGMPGAKEGWQKSDVTMADLQLRTHHVIQREIDVIRDQMRRNGVIMMGGETSFTGPNTLLVKGLTATSEVEAEPPADGSDLGGLRVSAQHD